MAIFICSDWHLWHRKILIYENRPFQDLNSMHKTIFDNINKTLTSKDDILINCGDICCGTWGTDVWPHTIYDFLTSLNGRMVLIRGNHDTDIRCEIYKECGVEVFDYLSFPKEKVLFTHQYNTRKNLRGINMSCENWNYMPFPLEEMLKYGKKDWLNICGHSHSRWRTREPKVNNMKTNNSPSVKGVMSNGGGSN